MVKFVGLSVMAATTLVFELDIRKAMLFTALLIVVATVEEVELAASVITFCRTVF